jgi:hypothetical protein
VPSDPDLELKDRLRKFSVCRLKVAIAERKLEELKAKPDYTRIDETHERMLERDLDNARQACADAFEKVKW